MLLDIVRSIYGANGCDIKLIWLVPKGNTATNTSQQQTKFIQNFSNVSALANNNNNNNNSSRKQTQIMKVNIRMMMQVFGIVYSWW